jgi:hypothetical protein
MLAIQRSDRALDSAKAAVNDIEMRLKCSSVIGLDGVMWVTTELNPENAPDRPLTDLLLTLVGRHELTVMRKANATCPLERVPCEVL